jgi:hypothetical protein
MALVQRLVLIAGLLLIVGLMVFPPWRSMPWEQTHDRLSRERMVWWAFGHPYVDKIDLVMELCIVAGVATGACAFLEMARRIKSPR